MFPFERHLSTQRRLQCLVVMIALIFVAIAPTGSAQVKPTAGQLQVNGAISIVFTADSVSCSGLTPGDRVALVGYMIDRQSSYHTIGTPMYLQEADANGGFSVSVPGGIKARSIWLLLDQTAGSYTVAEPEGSVLTQMSDQSLTLTAGNVAPAAVATINRAHTHVMLISDGRQLLTGSIPRGIRPADDLTPSGSYYIDAKDGSAVDEDGTINGSVQLTLGSFFDQSQNSVCLFVVDDRTLEFRVFYLQFAHSPVCRPGDC